MVLLGLVLALSGAALAVGIRWSSLRDPEALVPAALVLMMAVYGGSLAWRGTRGYSRPSVLKRRLMMMTATLFAVLGLVGTFWLLTNALRMDPIVMQRAPLISEDALNWRIAMMILAFPPQLVAHELGHLLAGRLVGFEFVGVQAGPFYVHRESGRWRVRWRLPQFGFAGRADMRIRQHHRLPERQAFFAAGGPLANFLLAAVGAGVSSAMGAPTSRFTALVVGVLGGCAVEGMLIGALNLIPVQDGSTDGSRILQALARASKGVR